MLRCCISLNLCSPTLMKATQGMKYVEICMREYQILKQEFCFTNCSYWRIQGLKMEVCTYVIFPNTRILARVLHQRKLNFGGKKSSLPIFHQNRNPFVLWTRVGLDPQHNDFALLIPTCWYLKTLTDPMINPREPKPTNVSPNASRSNMVQVW